MSFIKGNLNIQGTLTADQNLPSPGSIVDEMVQASADIDPTKLGQQRIAHQSQVHGTAATAERRTLCRINGLTGTLVAFRVGLTVAATGDSTVTVDLYKNGSTILSGTITIDNGNAAYSVEAAPGYASTALVQGDVLEVVQTVNAGTGTLPQGVFWEALYTEKAA